jgi:hypothetical protein
MSTKQNKPMNTVISDIQKSIRYATANINDCNEHIKNHKLLIEGDERVIHDESEYIAEAEQALKILGAE